MSAPLQGVVIPAQINNLTKDINYLADVSLDESIARNDPTNTLAISVVYQELGFKITFPTGAITGDGNASFTIQAAGFNGDAAKTVSVAVLTGQSVNTVSDALIAACAADADVNAFFDVKQVSGQKSYIAVVKRTPAAYDATMSASFENGTCTGITTVAGTDLYELVHNSVLYFPFGWNGYKYWMVFTPYPYSESAYENPSIVASNNGQTWVIPSGVTNPLIAKPASGYNSDPVLVADPDGVTVHMVYRETTTVDKLFVVSSTDGFQTITTPVKILEEVIAVSRTVSPALAWDGSQWIMWGIDMIPAANTLTKRTCATINGTYSAPTTCTITVPSGKVIWHMDVKKFGDKYYMLIVVSAADGNAGDLYLCKSTDGFVGETWAIAKNATLTMNSDGGFYKSSFVPMIDGNGLSFDLWTVRYSRYYRWELRRTKINFNRTQLANDYRNSLLQGSYLLSPYLFCDIPNTRADGALSVATCGKSWTNLINSFNVASGILVPASAALSRISYDLGTANHFASVKVTSIYKQYLIFRYVDSSNYWYMGFYSNGVLQLNRNVAGVTTAGYVDCKTCIVGDIIGVSCVGNNITVYVNNEPVQITTSADNNTGTIIGLQAERTSEGFQDVLAGTAS